jgi:hypothetical protein
MRAQVLSIVLSATACFGIAACGSDSNDSPGSGGGMNADRDSGMTSETPNSKCATTTPCASDTQCVSLGGSSCNTRTNLCQTVLCGDEGGACSVDSHCKKGFICNAANGSCKYDPTPRCYHAKDKVCIEGDDSPYWMKDCVDDGGEVISSCPTGRVAICRYMDGGKPISIWVYRESDIPALQQSCTALMGKISFSAD